MRLSICIPTYNFGRFIGQTLDSILPQLVAGVEVLILDGGSTDDTADQVRLRQAGCEQLRYFHQDFRGGIDRDIETAVKLATGDYCWLFSADDVMLPGAVGEVLAALHSGSDVYLCEHKLCDRDLRPLHDYPIFNELTGPTKFNLADAQQRREYFRLARNSEVFFSFLAGPIFRKAVWDQAPVPDSFRETYWIVAGHLLWGVRNGMTVDYLARCLLLKRGDNDSFIDRGIINRYRIAIDGFQHIAETIFGRGSEEISHIKRVLRFDVPLHFLLEAKWKAFRRPELESRAMLDRITRLHYTDQGISGSIKLAIYRWTPAPCVPILLPMKRAVGRMLRKFRKWQDHFRRRD